MSTTDIDIQDENDLFLMVITQEKTQMKKKARKAKWFVFVDIIMNDIEVGPILRTSIAPFSTLKHCMGY